MNKLIVIGANSFQRKLIEKANVLGYETHVFAWEEGATAKDIANYFYPISILDKEAILERARIISPIGITSIGSDLAMPTVNYVAKELGLKSNDLQCSELTTNKYSMREALKIGNIDCPTFQLVSKIEEVDFRKLKFPLIVKPIDRSGSRGINKVNSKEDLELAFIAALEVSFSDCILIEEFVEGKEYSVEYISENGEHNFLQITEKFTTEEPNFIERAHLAPARISSDIEKKIKNMIPKALNILKVENGASHSELKITSTGEIKIIEIAARMGGDFIGSDLVGISTGYDYVKNTINVAVDKQIDSIELSQRKISLVGFIFDEHDKKNFEILKDKFRKCIVEYQINEFFYHVEDSSSRNGYYILNIRNDDELNKILNIMNLV